MLQNAIRGVKRRARLCLEQNGEHFQHTGLFTRGVFLNFFLPQPIIHIATISSFQILKIIITESTMALSPFSLTLEHTVVVNLKKLFLQ
jgi:hypothetical protein